MKRALALILLLLPACKEDTPASSHTTETKNSAPDFASAFQHKTRWDAEKKALVVEVSIAPGFHAYTVGETTGKPLQVELAPDSELIGAGEIEYPKGVTKDLPIGRSVIVEGNAQIVAPLAPKDPSAPSAGKKAKGTLRYQVCTEKACDRPKTTPIEVNAS